MIASFNFAATVLQCTCQTAAGDLESFGEPFNNDCNVGSPSGPAAMYLASCCKGPGILGKVIQCNCNLRFGGCCNVPGKLLQKAWNPWEGPSIMTATLDL